VGDLGLTARGGQDVLSGRAQMDEEDLALEKGPPPDSEEEEEEEEEEERRRAAGKVGSVEAPAGGSWQKRGSLGGRSKRSAPAGEGAQASSEAGQRGGSAGVRRIWGDGAALDGAEEDEEDGYFNHALPRDGVCACPAPARPPARAVGTAPPRRSSAARSLMGRGTGREPWREPHRRDRSSVRRAPLRGAAGRHRARLGAHSARARARGRGPAPRR
jgi:hypothetical protein